MRADTKKVKDIMSRDVVSVDKDDRVEQVLELMRKHRVSKIPVTEHGKLWGVVTDGEIAEELGGIRSKGKPASALHASAVTVRDVKTITPEADWEDALELLQDDPHGILPVVHDGTVLGVVTKADFLPFVDSARPLSDVMVRSLHAVAPTDRVIHARRLMLDHGVERLPVLDAGQLVGVVAETDIAFGFARFKAEYSDNHQKHQLKEFLVQDIMVRKVLAVRPETLVRDAAKTMREAHVGCLPVTLASPVDRIAGMVTRSDLIATVPRDGAAARAKH